MADTTDNVIFEVFGDTAEFATDYGTSGTGFTQAHVQIVKMAFGDDSTTSRVSGSSGLPVQITGNTGNAVEVTGEIRGTGAFRVENYYINGQTGATLVYLAVAGDTMGGLVGVSGTVQGVCGGYPVSVTGDISVTNRVGIVSPAGSTFFRDFGATAGTTFNFEGSLVTGGFFPVVVTGGRQLNSSTDSVTVSGSVGVTGGRFLAAGTDSVSVLGSDLGTKVLTRVYAGDGTTIGASGDALKVAMTNTGITFTFNAAAVVGVTNSSETPLKVQGYTGSNGFPLTVRGENNGAVEVAATTALNVNVNNSSLTIDDDDILVKLGTTGDIYSKLNSIATNTSSVSTIRSDLQNGSASLTVNKINRPSSIVVGSKSLTSTDGGTQLSVSSNLGSGINVKADANNTGIVYVGTQTVSRSVGNGYPLDPGESIFLEISNANLIFVRTQTAGSQKVHYIGS